MRVLTLGLVLIGCGGSAPPVITSGGDGSGNDCDVSLDVEDIEGDLDQEACLDAEYFASQVSTTSYWIGDLAIDAADNITGTVTWIHYATENWEGGADCQAVWNLTGTRSGGFSSYYTLQVNEVYDQVRSTCDPDIVGESQFVADVNYTVQGGDCMQVFFTESGNFFASGQATANKITFVSNTDCNLF